MHSRWLILLSFVTLVGCERCTGHVPQELRVAGLTPYVRCLYDEPMESRKWQWGRAQFNLNGRDLMVTGLPESIRIAVFSGPAFSDESPAEALQNVAGSRPRLALVLGGIGDDPDKAFRTLKLLSDLEIPSLVIAGGRDRWNDLKKAFSKLDETARDRVIDATPLRTVRFGSNALILIAGSAHGHYARDQFSCGYGDKDLDSVAKDIGSSTAERRWLISWQVPAGDGPLAASKTMLGAQIGDESLGRLAKRIGARGGLFAWPDIRVMRPTAHRETLPLPAGVVADDLRVVVPRLVGPAIERDDGSRILPGFALVVLTKAGMLIEGNLGPVPK